VGKVETTKERSKQFRKRDKTGMKDTGSTKTQLKKTEKKDEGELEREKECRDTRRREKRK